MRLLHGFAALLLPVLTSDACGGEVSGSTCVAGQSIACASTSGCTGAQVCNSQGSYDSCICFEGGSPPTDGGGADTLPEVGAECVIPPDVAERWLAFDADRTSLNRNIYIVRGDGSQLTQLTTDPSNDIDPSFSHNGTSLAFASDRSGTMQIYVMNLAQGTVVELTSLAAGADEPNWSADDSQIVFHSGPSVYVMGADGTNPQVIGTGSDDFNSYQFPSLSLDGTQVLFSRNNEIDAREVSGSSQRYIVQNWTTLEETPALSPDGTQVAFGVECATVEQVGITPFSGSATPCSTELVTSGATGAARRPAWESNAVLAFERVPPANATLNIAVISMSSAPGCTPVDIIGPPGDDRDPNWAPISFEPSK